MSKMTVIPPNYDTIRAGIVELLKNARSAAARNVNSIMTATYWEIGRKIVELDQAGKRRADYGNLLIRKLATDLSTSFGRGFGARNLAQMRSFYLAWPQGKILQTLSAKSPPLVPSDATGAQSSAIQALAKQFRLPWSAYVRLLSVRNPHARAFYETEAQRSGWSVRQLDRQIDSQFYERVALSKKKAKMLEKARKPESSNLVTPEEAGIPSKVESIINKAIQKDRDPHWHNGLGLQRTCRRSKCEVLRD